MPNLISIYPSILSWLEVGKERYGPPLFAALATRSKDVVQTFVAVHAATQSPESPESRLHNLRSRYSYIEGSQGKFRRDFIFSNQRTTLSYIAELGDEVIFALALKTGQVDADAKDKDGRTPLSWAAESGSEAVVKLLLETGQVDIDSKNKDGRTPLSWAAESGHEAVVKLLLETGQVDIDSKNKNGRTPLSWAAESGHEAVVKLLLETGQVDVNSKGTRFGRTPLSWAVQNGHEAVIKLLQSHVNIP